MPCILVVHFASPSNWTFQYTAEEGEPRVSLGQWLRPLSVLLSSAIENGDQTIPLGSELPQGVLSSLTVSLPPAGDWVFQYASSGVRLTLSNWARPLLWLIDKALSDPETIVPTAAEQEIQRQAALQAEAEAILARAIPDDWEPTLDGVNVCLTMGEGMSWSRSYAHKLTGQTAEAPCAQDGAPIAGTREKLLAVVLDPIDEQCISDDDLDADVPADNDEHQEN